MIHIKKSTDKQFYFTMNSRNGQTIVTSETYKTHRGCMNGVKAVIKIAKGNIKIKDHTK